MKKLVILALLLVALAACETRVITTGQEQQNTLNVQGSSEFDVAPDLAKIRFRVETQNTNAQEAQAQNRNIANNVYAALLKAGIKENQIDTTDYRLERIQEWDSKEQRTVDRGYRATNTFVITTRELDRVGTLLDAGVEAGANNVESINFELSESKQKEVKTEALRNAANNAREKAEALADGAGVSLGKVHSISENSFVMLYASRYDLAQAKVEGAPTPVSPENVHISAQVSVAYELG